ncbi:hypothetical protein TRIATDRAFT_305527 [Trichoderma atroviride IMI 206040]|uniref:Uncharacterized protein n=1 Tax=Hypocrea atroviridis (strain ATCC 20476 / IMI 206040) TaxID=452589 RepID=G9NLG1_HYPAI|nr:uncharacterized protein TRIATDRAFT_305527 [Trichoderma atroviride IMI 206040]EHK48725.1 hypothetical protein TRIATDRAFT_305527 [Trichoderma atroviride IMI 206040]
MDEPDGALQARTTDEDASLFNMLPRYDDGYDWMSDPEGRLLQVSNDHQSIDAPYSPEYEIEPGLSPDSSLQGANFPTPTSIGQDFVMPATPSENAFEQSSGMSSFNNLNSVV